MPYVIAEHTIKEYESLAKLKLDVKDLLEGRDLNRIVVYCYEPCYELFSLILDAFRNQRKDDHSFILLFTYHDHPSQAEEKRRREALVAMLRS